MLGEGEGAPSANTDCRTQFPLTGNLSPANMPRLLVVGPARLNLNLHAGREQRYS